MTIGTNTRRAARFFVLFVAALAPTALVFGQPGSNSTSELNRLMKALAGRETLEAAFTETMRISVLTEPIVLRGTLKYRAPDFLRKQVLFPRPQTFVIDGDLLTANDPVQGERRISLREHPQLRAFVESIRATLAGDLAGLRKYYKMTFQGNEQEWKILLLPRDELLARALPIIELQGRGAEQDCVTIADANRGPSFMPITTTPK